MGKKSAVFTAFAVIFILLISCSENENPSAPALTPTLTPTPQNTPVFTPTIGMTPADVGGVIYHSAGMEGKQFFIYIDANDNIDDGYYHRYNNICGSNTFTAFSYHPPVYLNADLYVLGVVDTDYSGILNSGDYAGFAGALTPLNVPAAPNTHVPSMSIIINTELYQ